MFQNIDYSKTLPRAKFELAKLNKRIVYPINNRAGDSLSLKSGNISELKFSVPFKIQRDETEGFIDNPLIAKMKEKMLVKVTIGSEKEWFIIDNFEESNEDDAWIIVSAYSVGYSLRGKRVSGYEKLVVSPREFLTDILDGTPFTIGEIDTIFENMARSFESGEGSNALECITNGAETFGALIVWNTQNMTVSFKDFKTDGKFRGLTVNHGRLIKSVSRVRTAEEMITRLYVTGSEGLPISSVNPTGLPYLEDYSYFMYPFERDANRNVIKESDYMSNELCHALLDQSKLIKDKSPLIMEKVIQINEKETEMIVLDIRLDELNLQLETILDLLDIAKSAEDTVAINKNNADKTAKELEISNLEGEIESLQLEIDLLNDEIESLREDIALGAGFTRDLLEELMPYSMMEGEWSDENYIDVKELYEAGLEKFEKYKQPKIVVEVTIENLLNIVEEQYYWDKVILGDFIKVRYPQLNLDYMAKIIEIVRDFENDEVTLTIANTKDLLDENDQLVQLLYSNASASVLVENNKYKWDKALAVSDEVNEMLKGEWDATKNKIIAGVNNSIEIGSRGMIVTNPDFPSEMLIVQSGVLALSRDGGETWRTAIKPDGIVAERLIGEIIAGQELIITNKNNSFVLDNTGLRVSVESFIIEAGDINLVDRWQGTADLTDSFHKDGELTPYEKKMIKDNWDNQIKPRYEANLEKINNYYDYPLLVPSVVDYQNKYEILNDYLFTAPVGTKPILAPDNMDKISGVIRDVYDLNFKNYFASEVTVEKELSLFALNLANIAHELAEEAQNNIDELENDIVYKIELYSTNGLVFKNNIIDTEIIASLYRGSEDITSQLPKSAFIWTKTDKNGNIDEAWGNKYKDSGNVIRLTGQDVHAIANIRCQIYIE